MDVVITEIGGTVGDIEGLPFLEAIRQFALDVGRENCLYIHLTLVPYLKAAGELKTKPTQHSVGELRQIGIQPDILICRTELPISGDDKDKIALFCNVDRKAVIEERDKQFSIYEVPLSLVEHGLDDILVKRLGLQAAPLNLVEWSEMVDRIMNPKHEVRIAVVGKYMEHRDAYKSVYESLDHAGIAHRSRVLVVRVEAEEVEHPGRRGAARRRRRHPRARRLRHARHRGQDRGHPLRPDQRGSLLRHLPGHAVRGDRVRPRRAGAGRRQQHRVRQDDRPPRDRPDGRATLRRAARRDDAAGGLALRCWRPEGWPGELTAPTRSASAIATATSSTTSTARRSRSTGWSPRARALTGTSSRSSSCTDHPWFLAVQFHPEFQSKPTKAHPLFRDFVGAALQRKGAIRAGLELDGKVAAS